MGLKQKWNDRRRGGLLENTVMLYLSLIHISEPPRH